jgi:hypothetical protein
MTDTLEFRYGARLSPMLVLALLFTACAAAMAYAGAASGRGLVVGNLVSLAPREGLLAFVVVAGGAVIFVIGSVALVVRNRNPRVVRLTDAELSAPRNGLAREATVIPLHTVREIEVVQARGQRLLQVRHPAGELTIFESLVPNAAAFDALRDALVASVRAIGNAAAGADSGPKAYGRYQG